MPPAEAPIATTVMFFSSAGGTSACTFGGGVRFLLASDFGLMRLLRFSSPDAVALAKIAQSSQIPRRSRSGPFRFPFTGFVTRAVDSLILAHPDYLRQYLLSYKQAVGKYTKSGFPGQPASIPECRGAIWAPTQQERP